MAIFEECSSSFFSTEISQFPATLCIVTLWISRPFPVQAAVVLAKTEPEQQCSLFPVGDMEQMLHCRVLIQAVGVKRALDFFFFVSDPCSPLTSPKCPLLWTSDADQMLFLVQWPTSAYLAALLLSLLWLLVSACPFHPPYSRVTLTLCCQGKQREHKRLPKKNGRVCTSSVPLCMKSRIAKKAHWIVSVFN